MLINRLFLKIISKNPQVYWLQVVTLAIGFACAILMSLFLIGEFSYEKGYADFDNLFRVLQKNTTPEFNGNRLSVKIDPAVHASLETKTPAEILSRVKPMRNVSLLAGATRLDPIYIHAADSLLLSILSLEAVDRRDHRSQKPTVYLSDHTARELFGEKKIAGQSLYLLNDIDTVECVVGVVFESPNTQTQVEWNLLLKYDPHVISSLGFDPNDYGLYGKHPQLQSATSTSEILIDSNTNVLFQPLTDIYFGPRVAGEESRHGDEYSLIILTSITALIVLLAISNFINLTTILLPHRSKEIAVKKLAGSSNGKIFITFFNEAFFTNLLALALAFVILFGFSASIEQSLSIDIYALIKSVDGVFISIVVGILLVASFGPLLVVSRFALISPSRLLSSERISFPKFKRAITISQLSLSILLLTSSLIVGRQIQYSLIKEPGRNHEQIIYLKYPWSLSPEGLRRLQQTWRDTNPHVVDLMASSQLPFLVNSKEIGTSFYFTSVDPHFYQFFNLKIEEGRWFKPNEVESACLINTVAREKGMRASNVIGVFEDINGQFNQPARPLKFVVTSDFMYNYLCIRVLEVDIRQTVHVIASFFEIEPDQIFYLDEHFKSWMNYQDKLNDFSETLAIISMVIACCCVYGLGLSILREKHRDVVIYKMFGAMPLDITLVLMKTFSRDLAIAIALALPVTFLLLQEFLRTFVYVTPFRWFDFLFPALFSLVIISLLCWYYGKMLNRSSLTSSLRNA